MIQYVTSKYNIIDEKINTIKSIKYISIFIKKNNQFVIDYKNTIRIICYRKDIVLNNDLIVSFLKEYKEIYNNVFIKENQVLIPKKIGFNKLKLHLESFNIIKEFIKNKEYDNIHLYDFNINQYSNMYDFINKKEFNNLMLKFHDFLPGIFEKPLDVFLKNDYYKFYYTLKSKEIFKMIEYKIHLLSL